MQQSYEEVSIEQIVRQKIYSKDIGFSQNEENIHRLIPFLVALPPSQDSLTIAIDIIKFYRFPSIKIDQLDKTIQDSMQEQLRKIAAILSALLKCMGQDHFNEIAIFFKWGISKKKYRFQIAPLEIQFGTFIVGLSLMKDQIQKLGEVKGRTQEKSQKINDFLSMKMGHKINPFEEYFINHIMGECGPAILRIQDEEEQIYKKQNCKQKNAKVIQDNEPSNLQDFPSLLNNKLNQKQSPPFIDQKPALKDQPKINKQKVIHQDQDETNLNNPINSSDKLNKKSREIFINECAIIRPQDNRVTPICCRTCFYADETIEQPESLRIEYKLYNFPFISKNDEYPSKHEKIRKTLCGFLNAEGGTVYFGIKEDLNHQRFINGMFMTQTAKVEFRKEIFKLLKDIKPDVGKRVEIKWVPLRSRKDNNYISGKYVAKVIIERGAKDQVYSYEQPINNNRYQEKFAFRTENEVLLKSDAQEILKIFKNKIEHPQRPFFPIHNYPCKEPEVGKQVIGDQFSRDYKYDEDESYQTGSRNNGFKEKFREGGKDELGERLEQQLKERKKYMQKNCNEFMVKSKSGEDVTIELRKIGQLPIQIREIINKPPTFYVKLENNGSLLKSSKNLRVIEIYGRLSYRKLTTEQVNILETTIIPGYKQLCNQNMRNRQDKILLFHSAFQAAQFYLKMHDMEFKLEFTSEG